MNDALNLEHDRELLLLSGYFFEVIVKKYLAIERDYEKNETKIRSFFRRANFGKYVNAWNDLFEIVSDAESLLFQHFDVTVCIKLPQVAKESYTLMKSLITSQLKVLDLLVQKANSVPISMNEYMEAFNACKNTRDEMQLQMQLYDSTYRLYLMLGDMFPGMDSNQ